MFDRDPELQSNRPTPRPKSSDQSSGVDTVSAQLLGLQRAAGNAGVSAFLQRQAEEEESPVRNLMRSGGGSPIDRSTRQFMESRMGADFADVRIHTGGEATKAAQSVQAHAYTSGTDIVFQDGQYNPSSTDGQKMLAHELTHVVQQKEGPVDGSPAAGGLSISDPSDRFERAAEATADRVMSGGSVQTLSTGAGTGIQRQEGGEAEEEELQMSAIQRQEGGEAEEEELQMSAIQRQEGEEMEEEESV